METVKKVSVLLCWSFL